MIVFFSLLEEIVKLLFVIEEKNTRNSIGLRKFYH